ncbi:MAG: Single-stranded-DNA-specific exonuclease RecJ [Chloroflexi bacterium]|nr:Single-stranded-DNA-specific exonuclease RecJ [Chloroflexota bacterium]
MRWKILPPAPSEHLARCAGIPPLLAQLLYNRGIVDPSDAEMFLAADKRLENDSALLPEMGKAVAAVMRAVLGGRTIAVFGDFDVDGVTATTLLVQGLQRIGARVIPYIPHRVQEGHGLNMPALQKLHQQGVSLVITVDCGITANAEALQAREMGLDLIITDHHEVTGPIPTALAVVNPKRDDSSYPFRELAGVGVAFNLLQALFRATGRDGQADEFLDLVALGTVADMVPLLAENRYLVRRGLEVLNATSRLGLRELIRCAGLEMGRIDAESISFMLAPRLNAAGRLDHASVSYDLLNADSPEQARQGAELLETRNVERQRLTSHLMSLAEAKLSVSCPCPVPVSGHRSRIPDTVLEDTPLLMVAHEEFRAGVNGLVAGKLTDKYYRPALILEIRENESRGSARSIPEFNIVAALSECRDILSHFGGHAQAAGFTVPNENVESLRQRLLEIAGGQLADVELQPSINIDAEVKLADLGGETLALITRLEPFGKANPAPTFLSRGVKVVDFRRVGSDGEHLKLRLNDAGVVWDAIGFDINHGGDTLSCIDIVYNLKLNTWNGRESLELEIRDFRPT